MKGVKILNIKNIIEKKLVAVNFDGANNHAALLEAVKSAFHLPDGQQIFIHTNGFTIEEDIFNDYIKQYVDTCQNFVLEVGYKDDSDSQNNILPCSITNISEISSSQCSQASQSSLVNLPEFESVTPTLVTCENIQTELCEIIEWSPTGSDVAIAEILPLCEAIKALPEVKILLSLYEKEGALENKHRINLAKSIIQNLLKNNPSQVLKRKDFEGFSQSITHIFVSEVKETYYVPFQSGHQAKGKLIDAYNNYRTRLSSSGLITRRPRNRALEYEATQDNTCKSSVDDAVLDVITNGSEEWQKIVNSWIASHTVRKQELQDISFTTDQYLQKYCVLTNDHIYELLKIDTKLLYPDCKFIDEWSLFYEKVIAKSRKLKDHNVQFILDLIDKSPNENTKAALALMIVPFLLPSARRGTKVEVQRAFIIYSNNILTADQETRDRLKRSKLEAQPKIYFVGDALHAISLAYVDICGRRWRFDNPLKAIEVCFFTFISLNVKYPKTCSYVWEFLQKLIFQIQTPWDVPVPAVTTLIHDLQ